MFHGHFLIRLPLSFLPTGGDFHGGLRLSCEAGS